MVKAISADIAVPAEWPILKSLGMLHRTILIVCTPAPKYGFLIWLRIANTDGDVPLAAV